MTRAEAARALSAEILRGPTATAGLTRWCALRRLGDGPVLAEPLPDPDPREIPEADAAALLGALDLAPGDALIRRRVRLYRGGVTLSTADNWFAPDRLPAAIRDALETTSTPFGALVAPLEPWRKTLARRFGEADGAPPLEHLAIVLDAPGRPLCAVLERYTEAAVAPAAPGGACGGGGDGPLGGDAAREDEA